MVLSKKGHQENDSFFLPFTLVNEGKKCNLQFNITFSHLLSFFILLKLYNLVLSILSSVSVIKFNQMHQQKQASIKTDVIQNRGCIAKLRASETHHHDSWIHLLSSHQCYHLTGLLHLWAVVLSHCHLFHCPHH